MKPCGLGDDRPPDAGFISSIPYGFYELPLGNRNFLMCHLYRKISVLCLIIFLLSEAVSHRPAFEE